MARRPPATNQSQSRPGAPAGSAMGVPGILLSSEDHPGQTEAPHRVQESVEGNGLDEVGLGSELEGPVDVIRFSRSRKHHDRNVIERRPPSEPREDLESGPPRNMDVQKNQDGQGKLLWISIGVAAIQICDGVV